MFQAIPWIMNMYILIYACNKYMYLVPASSLYPRCTELLSLKMSKLCKYALSPSTTSLT